MMDDEDYLAMDGLPAGLTARSRLITVRMDRRQAEKVQRYVGVAKAWFAVSRLEQEHA